MLQIFTLKDEPRLGNSGFFSLRNAVTMKTQDDSAFSHDEADITMISYVLQAANQGKSVVHALSDDSADFVSLGTSN